MHRRAVLNLLLALGVAGLAVLAVLSPPAEKPAGQAPLVPGFPVDVDTIRVERPGKPALRLVRAGHRWYLHEPVAASAHPRRVRDLLGVPALPVSARIPAGRRDRARFGLDPAPVTLHLDDLAFDFGVIDALNGRRYVQYRDHVYLVPDTVYLQLTQDPEFFVDPRLLDEGMRPVRIAAPHRVIWLQDDAWHSDPAPAAGEPGAGEVARAWEAAQALAVRAGAEPGIGTRITLTFAKGVPVEFDFLERDGSPVLMRRDRQLQYLLDAAQVRLLMLVPAAP